MSLKTILVTGGAGFIGSNFITNSLKRFKSWNIINLDNLTYAGNLTNLESVKGHSRYRFVKGDISNKKLIEDLFKEQSIDYVVNFAAESHVDRSILNPDIFIKTNVVGTQVLLEAAKKYSVNKFIQISTDEVYGQIVKGKSKETDRLNPNNPYSASKASADLICRSYYKTFSFPVIIARLSNNYGPFQFPEKLVPLMILNAINHKKLPLYGNGKNIRDWIYVEDSCDAIMQIINKGSSGEIYNIGSDNERSNNYIVQKICSLLSTRKGNVEKDLLSLVEYVKDRPCHDFRYCMDSSKINKEIGWIPKTDLDAGLKKTVVWYLNNPNWADIILNKDYKKYYNMNYSNR